MHSLPPGWRVNNSSGSYSGPPRQDEPPGSEEGGIEDDNSIADSNEDVDVGIDIRPDSPGWEDAEPDDEETIYVQCLLCDSTFSAVNIMLDHCKGDHGFDFLAIRSRYNLDFYGTIKLVNYLRSNGIPDLNTAGGQLPSLWTDERYLQPVLENDPMLFSLDDIIDFGEEDMDTDVENGEGSNADNNADLIST